MYSSMPKKRPVSSKVTPRRSVISLQEKIMRNVREEKRQHMLHLSGLGGRPTKSKDII